MDKANITISGLDALLIAHRLRLDMKSAAQEYATYQRRIKAINRDYPTDGIMQRAARDYFISAFVLKDLVKDLRRIIKDLNAKTAVFVKR